MTSTASSAQQLQTLLDIEAIKQLKYAYLRHLDLKEWDALAALFSEDVVSSYSDGKHSYAGRAAVMEFLQQSLGHKRVVTKHQAHHPEIQIAEDGQHARGIWYLTDAVINTISRDVAKHFCIAGTAFYEDEYRRVDGEWKITAIGYRRVYEDTTGRETGAVHQYKSRFLGDFD